MDKKKKKYLLWSMTGLVMLGQLNFAVAQDATDTAPFSDVAVGSRYYIAVKHLKENGLVIGYEDGTFKPLQEINRAEAIKVLQLAVKKDNTNPAKEIEATADATGADGFAFDDVTEDAWYYPYIRRAWEDGVVKGYPDGLFHPEKTINTAESLKIVIEQENLPLPAAVTTPPYGDVPVDAWFAPYAQVSSEKTLIVASRGEGKLYPADNMNRGDFAELIYHLIQSRDGHRFSRATWYSDSLSMQSTANRELYIPTNLTAAHKTLPFGTTVKVTNSSNGKSVEVRINDRGPYVTGVELDLSRSAFEAIASTGAGVIFIEYATVETGGTTDPLPPDPETIDYGF
jgi:rare lipoprotein A